MDKKLFLIFIVFLATSYIALAAEIDLLGLTLDVKESGVDVDNVNLTVEIYDAATEEKSVCNSNNNFSRSTVKIKEIEDE